MKIDKDGKISPYILNGLWEQISQLKRNIRNNEKSLDIYPPSKTHSLISATMSIAAGLVVTHVLMTLLGEENGENSPLAPLPQIYCYDTINLVGSYIKIPS